MAAATLLDGFKRRLSLYGKHISSLPVVMLEPHGGCNCRCLMCDIWKGNARKLRLEPEDVAGLTASLIKLNTRWVVMTGGEALMHPLFFELCRLLRPLGLKITVLSTGLLLKAKARELTEHCHEIIVSLDGSEQVHDAIRRVPGAYRKLVEGVAAIKSLQPGFPVSGRCVIQRENFRDWPRIPGAARELSLDHISFLAADVSSQAFNRPEPWDAARQGEVALGPDEVGELEAILARFVEDEAEAILSGFVAESAEKLWRIHRHYAALAGLGTRLPVRCNAPWVSAVVEADGSVRPCFFHKVLGNIRRQPLARILNAGEAVNFRQELNTARDPICRKCVCSLYLTPGTKL